MFILTVLYSGDFLFNIVTLTDKEFNTLVSGIDTVATNKYNAGNTAGTTAWKPTTASLGNDGSLTVKNASGISIYTQSFTNNYNSGYNAGVTDADNRANANSANYKAGYNAGKSDASTITFEVWGGRDYSSGEGFILAINSQPVCRILLSEDRDGIEYVSQQVTANTTITFAENAWYAGYPQNP